jgi:hypothetical protein
MMPVVSIAEVRVRSTDEHAVSAGLGDHDNAWLLTGCVCRACNTDIFLKLETKFLHASPVAIA